MASSATSRAGSYISGTSSGRNRGDVMCPSACGDLAACRHRRLSRVERERAQRLFGRGDVLLARARGERRRRGHDHPRVAILEVRAHQPGDLLAPAGGERADRRGAHLGVDRLSASARCRPTTAACRSGRAASIVRSARARTSGESWWSSSGEIRCRLSKRLEQIDRMQHMPRVRVPELLDERLDRRTGRGRECRRSCGCTFSVSRLRRNDSHVAALARGAPPTIHSADHGEAGVADLRPRQVESPGLDQHQQDQRARRPWPTRSTVTSTNGLACRFRSAGSGRKRISRVVLSTV